MGREPAETVAHEYDVDGVLVASRVTREPEWDAEQRAFALAFVDFDNGIGPHGHPMSEATDPTALDPEGAYHYVAEQPLIDAAEQARHARRKAWIDEHGAESVQGVIFPVRKVLARDP